MTSLFCHPTPNHQRDRRSSPRAFAAQRTEGIAQGVRKNAGKRKKSRSARSFSRANGKTVSLASSTPSSSAICMYAGACGQAASSAGCYTCTPRPCIWMTWALRVWMAARINFWCSREVMPRLRTSLQTHSFTLVQDFFTRYLKLGKQ